MTRACLKEYQARPRPQRNKRIPTINHMSINIGLASLVKSPTSWGALEVFSTLCHCVQLLLTALVICRRSSLIVAARHHVDSFILSLIANDTTPSQNARTHAARTHLHSYMHILPAIPHHYIRIRSRRLPPGSQARLTRPAMDGRCFMGCLLHVC